MSLHAQPNTYKITNLKMNNELSQFGLVYKNDNKVVFSSHSSEDKRRSKRRKIRPILSLFEGELTSEGEIINVKPFDEIHDEFFRHSSNVAFSPDRAYIYITTSASRRGKNYKKNSKHVNLQIEVGEYVEGKGWTNFKVLPFCDKNFSYGHPAISPDGKTLYFVSNIPSAKGPTDIFKIAIDGAKTTGKPINLGRNVNSSRKEMFPFVSQDNVLYFSSNRALGKGGLDVYKSELNSKGQPSKAQALSSDINSKYDDFCFVINAENTSGYFSSKRPNGKGDDDIYYFTIK